MAGDVLMFTGHRPRRIARDAGPWVRRRLADALERWEPDLVLSGMALGTDTWAAEAAVAAGVGFVAYVPCPGQAERWPLRDRSRHAQLLAQAVAVVVVHDGPCSAAAYHDRDRRMVRNSTGPVVAVWDGREGGGTWATIRYARHYHRPVAVIDPVQRRTYWHEGQAG